MTPMATDPDNDPLDSDEPAEPWPVCPLCGGAVFVMGQLQGYHQVSFIGPERGFLGLPKGQKLSARKCQACGHVLLFAS
jgi:DNA-directed RNA polymerase subunit RPC12/RpoP